MNIIHLSSNRIWGGVERYILDLAAAQRDAGEHVVLFTRGFEVTDAPFREAGLDLRRIALKGVADIVSPVRLARYISSETRGDVIIHAHNFKNAVTAVRAARLCRGRNLKVIVTIHFRKVAHTSAYWSRIYRRIDSIISVSGIIRDIFLSSHPSIDPGKIVVVHNSVMAPEPPLTGHVADAASPMLTYVGRISPDKGVSTLIEAAGMISSLPFRLRIIGTGAEEYVGSLKALAESLGVARKIEWLGHKADIYPFIAGSAAGVAPSVCTEAFGLTIIEFMSQGIPVIASGNGAQPEIITSGVEGLLVPPGDAAALAAAMRRILEDPSARRDMGLAARRKFLASFSFSRYFSRVQELYRRVLDGGVS